MMFFFKQKPLVLNCVTANAGAHRYAPIDKALKFLPDWWKALTPPRTKYMFDEEYSNANMRHCMGMIDLYKNAVCLPMWSDLDVRISPEGSTEYSYQYGDKLSQASEHPPSQYTGLLDTAKVQHLKLHSPWFFFADEPVPWVAAPATFSHDISAYQLLPGVMDFTVSSGTNPQLLFHKRPGVDSIVHIKHRTPMYLYIPQTTREVEIRNHLVTSDELGKYADGHFSRNRRGLRVAALSGPRPRCPIHAAKG